MSEERNNRKLLVGKVTSHAMHKTITVKSERVVQHPRFLKYVKRYTTYHAHDENEEALSGDTVEVMECRPLSKTKFHRLVRIVRRAKENVEAAAAAEAAASEGKTPDGSDS